MASQPETSVFKPGSPFLKLSSSVVSAYTASKLGVSFFGNIMWVVGTALLVVGGPLVLVMYHEELAKQEASALGGPMG